MTSLLLQIELDLIDIGTLIAVLSTTLAVFSFGYTWIKDRKSNRASTAMDALANRLLPFYSIILESIGKTNLFLMLSDVVEYDVLSIDPERLYDKAADAFVYMQDASIRQLVINTIQILQAIRILEEGADSSSIVTALGNTLPLLYMMKNHIETYLDEYSKILNVQTLNIDVQRKIADLQAENTLKSVLEMIMKSKKDNA